MAFDLRRLAVALSGFCTFLNLYSPQALLPELSREFGATPAEISTIMTAGTLAVALTAPITGTVAGIYVMGSSIGGFCGRLVPGVLADLVGWRAAFLVLAAITLVAAIAVAFM